MGDSTRFRGRRRRRRRHRSRGKKARGKNVPDGHARENRFPKAITCKQSVNVSKVHVSSLVERETRTDSVCFCSRADFRTCTAREGRSERYKNREGGREGERGKPTRLVYGTEIFIFATPSILSSPGLVKPLYLELVERKCGVTQRDRQRLAVKQAVSPPPHIRCVSIRRGHKRLSHSGAYSPARRGCTNAEILPRGTIYNLGI